MARPLRIEYPGAYYHVMNRGLSRRCVFRSNRPPNPEQSGQVIRDKAAGGRSEATLEFFS